MQTYEFIDGMKKKHIPRMSELRITGSENVLLALDVLMVTATSNRVNLESLIDIVTRDSHHHMSVIFVCQDLNYGDGKL